MAAILRRYHVDGIVQSLLGHELQGENPGPDFRRLDPTMAASVCRSLLEGVALKNLFIVVILSSDSWRP